MRYIRKAVCSGLLVGAAAGLLTVGMTSAARANAFGYATLDITDFQIFGNQGQLDFNDFAAIDIGNSTTANATLTGFAGAANSDGPNQGGSDVIHTCLGAPCGGVGGIGQNDFTQQPIIQQFARGDAVFEGAGITGVLPGVDSAHAQSVAEIQLSQTSAGTGGGNVGTATTFEFEGFDSALTFQFNADPFLAAQMFVDDLSASASVAWSLSIDLVGPGGGRIFTWVPDGTGGGAELDPFTLNTSVSVLDDSDGLVTYGPGIGFFSNTTPILLSGNTYNLTITHTNTVAARVFADQVPEPAAAGLLGLALVAFAGMRRRWGRSPAV